MLLLDSYIAKKAKKERKKRKGKREKGKGKREKKIITQRRKKKIECKEALRTKNKNVRKEIKIRAPPRFESQITCFRAFSPC